MMAESIKISFITYLNHLGLYDYIGLLWYGVTFIILIILAIFIAKRSSVLSLFVIILALLFCVITPFVLKYKLNSLLRPTAAELQLVKKLTFSDTLIIEALIRNTSEKPFSTCLIQTHIYKKTEAQGIKATLLRLKPFTNQSILSKSVIAPNADFEFKTAIDGFTYDGEVNADIKAECYK